MGHYVSNMIGIRTGGVFSEGVDVEDMQARIESIVKSMRGTDVNPDISDDPSHCMSRELLAHKGAYVVLAGVFNYWGWPEASEFSRRLSDEFGTEVMHMCWDEETNDVNCNIFLAGKPLYDTKENPIGRTIRRVG